VREASDSVGATQRPDEHGAPDSAEGGCPTCVSLLTAYQILTRSAGARYNFSPASTSNAAYQGSRLRTSSARYWPGEWPSVQYLLAERFVATLLGPGLSEGEKELLIAGESVMHRGRLAASENLYAS